MFMKRLLLGIFFGVLGACGNVKVGFDGELADINPKKFDDPVFAFEASAADLDGDGAEDDSVSVLIVAALEGGGTCARLSAQEEVPLDGVARFQVGIVKFTLDSAP